MRCIGGYTFNSQPPRSHRVARYAGEESPPVVDAPDSNSLAQRELSFLPIPAAAFEYEDHTADIRIRATGNSVGSVLKGLGLGLFNYMTDITKVEEAGTRHIEVEQDNFDRFVFHFMDEMLGLYGDGYFMVSRVEFAELELQEQACRYKLKAICFGEKFDRTRHEQRTEVKAITMHDFCFAQTEKETTMIVLVDI
eukprot:Protomagalhaensia_sp_Gyna_25__2739@NODE_2573_length_1005_cov_331_409938_g2136_i0_p1_GENE_NODE_2573_length_1005_cov_331_409938_g2136_i0NODE_2573_length_1005_cov_331_409938_g2136_i0_p1_ORF_typecomplete_len195_score24_79Archease/PF01951_16/5_8e36_NODE_2573_length_1005_cov_331_409938_g2136_i0258842